jgi:hypothetical protein
MPKLLELQYDAVISVASTAIMILVINYAGRPTEIAIDQVARAWTIAQPDHETR